MSRFFRRGVSKVLFSPTVTDTDGVFEPDRTELDGAEDLSVDIAELSGFELTNDPINTPNLADQFTPQIEGEDTVPASSLTIYDRTETETIRTALEKGTEGFLFFLPYGDEPEGRMEVWPVKSNGVNDVWTTGAEAARFNVPFSITAVPQQNVEIPAAAP